MRRKLDVSCFVGFFMIERIFSDFALLLAFGSANVDVCDLAEILERSVVDIFERSDDSGSFCLYVVFRFLVAADFVRFDCRFFKPFADKIQRKCIA